MPLTLVQLLIVVLVFAGVTGFCYALVSMILERLLEVQQQYAADKMTWQEQLKLMMGSKTRSRSAQAIAAVLFFLLGSALDMNGIGLICCSLGGWILPPFIVNHFERKRLALLEAQYQPSLLLLAGSLKAGLSLPQAVESSQDLVPAPLSDEYRVIVRELRLGVPVPTAFANLADRIPLSDVRVATDAILVSIKTGANLAAAFDKISATIRARNNLRGKIGTMTVQGKAQGIVAGLAPIAFGTIFYLIDPNYMQPFFRTMMGNCLIGAIILLQVAAYFAIRKITNVTV